MSERFNTLRDDADIILDYEDLFVEKLENEYREDTIENRKRVLSELNTKDLTKEQFELLKNKVIIDVKKTELVPKANFKGVSPKTRKDYIN